MKLVILNRPVEAGNPTPDPIENLQRLVRKPFLFRFWPKKARDSWYIEKRIELYGYKPLEEEHLNEFTKR